MAKITKRTVDALVPGTKDVFLWDSELRGFGARMKPSGALSYLVQYRNHQGRSRRLTVSSHGRLTADEARREGKILLGDVEKGKDPAGERANLRSAPTVSELCDRYLVEHARVQKKASSIVMDESNIRNHIKPVLGHLKTADVTRSDIDKLRRAVRNGRTQRVEKLGPHSKVIVRGGPGAANRCLALLSKMFNLAEKWGLRSDGSNPCRHVEKYPGQKCERFLNADEMAALGTALSNMEQEGTESTAAIAAIRLLLFTGCRLGEILTLQWGWLDLKGACLRLPDSKSGAKVVYLSAPAITVLRAIQRDPGNPFVIPGDRRGKPESAPPAHLVNLQKPWERVRERATLAMWRIAEQSEDDPISNISTLLTQLERDFQRPVTMAELRSTADFELPTGLTDVRLHDLRHSFASVAVGAGEGLHMIGKLLGHTQAQTTHRYAHLANDPMKAAAERVGKIIEGNMNGNILKTNDLKNIGHSR